MFQTGVDRARQVLDELLPLDVRAALARRRCEQELAAIRAEQARRATEGGGDATGK
jgi:hypothetical protein